MLPSLGSSHSVFSVLQKLFFREEALGSDTAQILESCVQGLRFFVNRDLHSTSGRQSIVDSNSLGNLLAFPEQQTQKEVSHLISGFWVVSLWLLGWYCHQSGLSSPILCVSKSLVYYLSILSPPSAQSSLSLPS